MNQHFCAYSAVFPVLLCTRGGRRQVLLHRRQNTGYMEKALDPDPSAPSPLRPFRELDAGEIPDIKIGR